MKAYLVNYDLFRPGQNYPKLFEALEAYPTHWHMMFSTWIIATDESAYDVVEKLRYYVDSNDKLFVTEIQEDTAWYGTEADEDDWLRSVINHAVAA